MRLVDGPPNLILSIAIFELFFMLSARRTAGEVSEADFSMMPDFAEIEITS